MGLAQFGVCKPLTASNPMFGARRLSLNRYESVVALTPNIKLDSVAPQGLKPCSNFGPFIGTTGSRALPGRFVPQKIRGTLDHPPRFWWS
jgi:hypothetical protein